MKASSIAQNKHIKMGNAEEVNFNTLVLFELWRR